MRKTKREKSRIKEAGQAQAISQEILAGLRRNSHEQVSMDEDSMENIDAYWNMANKELEEMERRQYEDISMMETIGKMANESVLGVSKEGSKGIAPTLSGDSGYAVEDSADSTVKSSTQIVRRSFDEEFQNNLQNVILSGFSDSEESENKNEKAASPVPQSTASASIMVRRRKKSSKANSAPSAKPRKLLYMKCIKDEKNNTKIIGNGLKLIKISIKPKNTKKIDKDCFYYVVKGSVIVEDAGMLKKEKVSVEHKKGKLEGRQLKGGAVFSNPRETVVYNPGITECMLLMLGREKKERKRKQ